MPISSSNFSNSSSLGSFASPKPVVSTTRYFFPSTSNSSLTALQQLAREKSFSLNLSE
ncbi:MAG: hypothetical protein MRERV_61c007 [Mycoplasmataceae bacterium RV_VA103A]|nr:MAG: hypothetical protein MRERV_61c007 [Mycoplasmataceae bacterium RV_VA103A]